MRPVIMILLLYKMRLIKHQYSLSLGRSLTYNKVRSGKAQNRSKEVRALLMRLFHIGLSHIVSLDGVRYPHLLLILLALVQITWRC